MEYPPLELVEQAQHQQLPSTIVKDSKTPVSPLLAELQFGVEKLNERMSDLMEFLFISSQGACSCSYAVNPNCLPCKAKDMLVQMQKADAPPEPPPLRRF